MRFDGRWLWPLLLRPVGGIERVEYGRRQEYGFEKTVLKYVGNESDFPLMVSRKEQCTHDAASGWQLSESSRAILDGLADAKQTCFRNGRQLSEAIISFDPAALVSMVRQARPAALSRHALFPLAADTSATSPERIFVPFGTRDVKVSVGESFQAPNARKWFDMYAEGVAVYAFEPMPASCTMVSLGLPTVMTPNRYRKVNNRTVTLRLDHMYLRSRFVNTRYFLTCAGISDEAPSERTFYTTPTRDVGTSSLSLPTDAKMGAVRGVTVNITTLANFFERVPWAARAASALPAGSPGVDSHLSVNYVSQLKTDMQGHDLKGLRSAGRFLRERVVYVTPEMSAPGYQLPADSGPSKLSDFLYEQGFDRVYRHSRYCKDAVFVNRRLRHLASAANVVPSRLEEEAAKILPTGVAKMLGIGLAQPRRTDAALYGPSELQGAGVACMGV